MDKEMRSPLPVMIAFYPPERMIDTAVNRTEVGKEG